MAKMNYGKLHLRAKDASSELRLGGIMLFSILAAFTSLPKHMSVQAQAESTVPIGKRFDRGPRLAEVFVTKGAEANDANDTEERLLYRENRKKGTHHRGANKRKKQSRVVKRKKRTARKKRFGGTYNTGSKPMAWGGTGSWLAPPAWGGTEAPPAWLYGTCGGGSIGNAMCPNRNECCSEFGFCGTSAEYCTNKLENTGPTTTRFGKSGKTGKASKAGSPVTGSPVTPPPSGKPTWSGGWVYPSPPHLPQPIECDKWGSSSNHWGGGYDPCIAIVTHAPTDFPTYIPEPTPQPTATPETLYPTYATVRPTPTTSTTEPTPSTSTTEPTPLFTYEPTPAPTDEPTLSPSYEPTQSPTSEPTLSPMGEPTLQPTLTPTFIVNTLEPTLQPTLTPTFMVNTLEPTLQPTLSPTFMENMLEPTLQPTLSPMFENTLGPTQQPTLDDSLEPTFSPMITTPTFFPTPNIFEASRLLWAWGSTWGIGVDVSQNILVPQDVDELVLDASAGTYYSLFILADGSARVGGYIETPENYRGHFGLGIAEVRGVNTLSPILEVEDLKGNVVAAPEFRMVVAGVESAEGSGHMHSVFIDIDGNVYAAGNNDKGQLCLGDTEHSLFPTQIKLPGGETAESAVVGGEFTLILTTSGKLYGCGSNELGQLGLGDDVLSVTTPDDKNGLTDVLSISAGQNFALIRTSDGLFVMGDNTYGQLCLDTGGAYAALPTLIDSADDVIPSTDVKSFKAGRESTYIVFKDGSVVACGLNDVGQLGDGSFNNSFGVVSVERGSNIVDVGTGPSAKTVFYITSDGQVSGNGMNNFGQLGVGDERDREFQVDVTFQGDAFVQYISAADTHTVGLTSDVGIVGIPTISPTLGSTQYMPTMSPALSTTQLSDGQSSTSPTNASTTESTTVSSPTPSPTI